jgi:NAD(P)-dependent dehydrogenase (short-subunit alcohol dehydrogenase family)
VVAADVGDADAVFRLASRTVDRFGRIDVWVNNAGVILYGRFEDTPAEDFEQVVRTNLLGRVHGARAALRQYRAQGRGVLINMGSVWGRVSSPQVSAYVASKHAVRAFSECLRQEPRNDRGIDVGTMLPQAADTPIFRHAGNYSLRAADHPSVSTPVGWDEVEAAASGDGDEGLTFSPHEVLERASVMGDLFRAVLELPQQLDVVRIAYDAGAVPNEAGLARRCGS